MYRIALLLLIMSTFTSCKKCYDCSKKCGTCTLNASVLAGCEGDEALDGFSVDSWKLFLEGQGYTCVYSSIDEEACGKEEKDNKEDADFECVSQ
jgi:hypothetical protein